MVEEDSEHMELYTQNAAARSAVERELRVAGHKTIGEAAHVITRTAAPTPGTPQTAATMPATGTTITITARHSRQPRRQPSEPR